MAVPDLVEQRAVGMRHARFLELGRWRELFLAQAPAKLGLRPASLRSRSPLGEMER